MQSTENKEIRIEMVRMHDYFLDKINHAIEEERYIEASWLIYACMENRFFRTLLKFRKQCKYCKGKCASNKNELAISTKNACIVHLAEAGVPAIADNFSIELLENIRLWVKDRNNLMHKLLGVDSYTTTDIVFEKSAKQGKVLLEQLYNSCTNFRTAFYTEGYEFVFPEAAMDLCRCNPANSKSKEK